MRYYSPASQTAALSTHRPSGSRSVCSSKLRDRRLAMASGVAYSEVPWWLPKGQRSEEHTSELQSLMRISYAVFCLKKNIRKRRINYMKKQHTQHTINSNKNTTTTSK